MKVPFLSLKDITASYSEEIHSEIDKVINSGWYLAGLENEAFNKAYASYIGTKYSIGVSNGLEALSLILRAYKEMGIMKDGDEIIVPANTFIATILAITENKLTPVFIEPKFDTLEIDDSLIEEKITSKTKGIIIVHLYGRCAYTKIIGQLCKKYNLKLIEDNAQAHGCCFDSTKTGALGDAAGHSFYPGKNLGALGDAGAITTSDKDLMEIVHMLGNYGSSKKYEFKYIGKNSRLDEIQAAVLLIKLKYLDDANHKRQNIAKKYYQGINNIAIKLPKYLPDCNNVYHIFPVFCEYRDKLQKYLIENDIETIIHYPIPPHKQECYSEYKNLDLPITEKIHAQELSLPMSPTLREDQIDYVIEKINNFSFN